ncbi:hypothetical protein P3T35_003150 [Kitasatospora sp. GP30]|nr:hypothetical protein [Kitasatospora sp. GP30]MDH6141137.1 hypothetical protein [Kitasatospora sp. GP30]
MTEQQSKQTPWVPVAGHLSGSGTHTDAPTPPGIPEIETTEATNEPEDQR